MSAPRGDLPRFERRLCRRNRNPGGRLRKGRSPPPSYDGAMPIRITRVYTRAGDSGETALVGGRRVPKDSPRIEAYGSVDELNAIIGLVRAFNAERLEKGEALRWLDETLRRLQNQLFDLGSELATP